MTRIKRQQYKKASYLAEKKIKMVRAHCNSWLLVVASLAIGATCAQSPCCIQPDINGPSACTTVGWCNEAQGNCEGNCEGTWTTLHDNTSPAPANPTPQPVAVSNPTLAPVAGGSEPCCIQPDINGPSQCTTVAWCNAVQANCEGDCEGTWTTLGGNPSPAPVAAANPTPQPVVVATPTPVPPSGGNEPCCIQPDINGPSQCTTVPWCNEAQANCEGDCEGSWRIIGPSAAPVATNPTAAPVAAGNPTLAPAATTPPPVSNAGGRSTFFFGHSLIYHTFTTYPNVNVLGVPFWLNDIHSAATNSNWLGDGEFRTANYPLPASPGWGFQPAISAWQGDFTGSGYDSVVYTELNYVQYKPPGEPYDYNDQEANSPVESVLRIIDYVNDPNVPVYLYECWNDGGATLPDDVLQASTSHRDAYYASADSNSAYHQWWVDLYDQVVAARPGADVRFLPVGSTLVEVLRSSPTLSATTIGDLFEDNSPHGRPTIYFLAGLIVYISLTGSSIPSTYTPPNDGTLIAEVLGSNFDTVTSFIEGLLL